ncbi:MAG: hypothetical protein MUF01_10900, partial [Bryobacterales bacterium]|nr:hypothetical protein [Bryobacterales bacterium]
MRSLQKQRLGVTGSVVLYSALVTLLRVEVVAFAKLGEGDVDSLARGNFDFGVARGCWTGRLGGAEEWGGTAGPGNASVGMVAGSKGRKRCLGGVG